MKLKRTKNKKKGNNKKERETTEKSIGNPKERAENMKTFKKAITQRQFI